jgi:hypothetical protein
MGCGHSLFSQEKSMIENENNQAAEEANAPQDTKQTVDESLQSAPELVPLEEVKEEAQVLGQALIETDKAQMFIDEALEGLVKMHKGDQTIHAHPTTIHDHEKNGWKVT